MMKKFISIFMCIILVILSGCSIQKTPDEIDDTLLKEYLNNIGAFETPVHEFGTPMSYIHMEDGISVGVLYPDTEYRFLNKEITKWVEEITEEYIEEAESKQGTSAELAVSYKSYLVGESTVSILLEGSYISSYMAHPIDIIKTFNADIKEKDF